MLGVSCADGDPDPASSGRRGPGRVSSRDVGQSGQGGAGSGPSSAAGGALTRPLDGAVGGTDDPGILPGDQAGGAPPSCTDLSGAVCGANMSPAGDPAMRYFCASGVLIAQARCPGVCVVKNNACGMGTGTGDGMDDASLGVTLHCRECLSVDCKQPLVACDDDPWCSAHLDCKESCTIDSDCLSTCADAFPEDPLMDELSACVPLTDCPAACGGD